jgi:hypothetical protein
VPQYGIIRHKTDEANAQLIVAAPDMYEVLKDLRAQIPELYGDYIQDGRLTVTLDANTVERIFDVLAELEAKTKGRK